MATHVAGTAAKDVAATLATVAILVPLYALGSAVALTMMAVMAVVVRATLF